jgi:NAD(P)-dependent dehydrogenase (short-subunit alcohol dehydrogenase family)
LADTSRDSDVEAAVAEATGRFGGIDILVNGAAKVSGGPPVAALSTAPGR